MPVTYKQDLPPPGGYEGIKVKRVPMRQYFTGYQIILGYIGITAASAWYYFQGKKRMNRDFVEMHSSHLAVLPMLVAEQDRAYLKHLRKIRDEESKLMANIPNWQVCVQTIKSFRHCLFKYIQIRSLGNKDMSEAIFGLD
ncbi:hypothetical protein QYM36_016707 [Artemia franciscana]|uniref:NADH dehydrogenase [ubiquinone] 1 alpha subcomplex subunit 13 n=1 Tax=Artemia franciscana TaxID=6661 RepID=A0AA88HFE0_ARTSF|nr:hypothetical protein QYM36_016707 [Artemia franciscana]